MKPSHDHLNSHQARHQHLQPDSLEVGTRGDMPLVDHQHGMIADHGMPNDRDSGLSTEGSQQSEPPEEELITIRVSEEVKRFQQEINKVAIENTRFHHWKKTRATVGSLQSQHTVARRSASFESLVEVANPMLEQKQSSSSGKEEQPPPCLPPRNRFTSQDSLLTGPTLPPRSKTSKRVSYAPQEAIVLGSPPETTLRPPCPTCTTSLSRGDRGRSSRAHTWRLASLQPGMRWWRATTMTRKRRSRVGSRERRRAGNLCFPVFGSLHPASR